MTEVVNDFAGRREDGDFFPGDPDALLDMYVSEYARVYAALYVLMQQAAPSWIGVEMLLESLDDDVRKEVDDAFDDFAIIRRSLVNGRPSF